MPESLTRGRRLGYALGNAGFMLPDRVVVILAVYFYLPPEDVPGLVPLVSQELLFGGLTLYGLARIIGGLFDSAADPLVGFGSDRSHSRLGRRRVFLIAGVAPMCLVPVLLFWPPGAPGSFVNFAWLAVVLGLYYVFFTIYVGPYLALLPEIAPNATERVRLSTTLALVGFPVMMGFTVVYPLGIEYGRSLGFETPDAIRVVVIAACALGFVLCLGPIIAIDEARDVAPVPTTMPFREALSATLRNRPFLIYLSGQILFILGVTMLQPAMLYFAVVVLGRSEGFAGLLSAATGPSVVLGFWLVQKLPGRIGARLTMVGSVGVFALGLMALGLVKPDVPGGPNDLHNLVVVFGAMGLTGLSIAGFFVMPHVLISQLIDLDAAHTGANRSAMYFGVQGLLTKWVYAASLALLSSLFALFGNSREEPMGVILIGPVAGGLCVLAAGLFALYPERSVLEETARLREAIRPQAPR